MWTNQNYRQQSTGLRFPIDVRGDISCRSVWRPETHCNGKLNSCQTWVHQKSFSRYFLLLNNEKMLHSFLNFLVVFLRWLKASRSSCFLDLSQQREAGKFGIGQTWWAKIASCWSTEEPRPERAVICAILSQTNLFTHSKSGHHQLCNLGGTVKVTGCTWGQSRKTQKISS